MGTLFVVATPIGNLEDITLRALRVLKEAAVIAAEDTRRTRKLLTHYGIATPLVSFHAHNQASRIPELIGRLQAGESVALVSDAGTPGFSDPGADLAAAAWEAGLRVEAAPGPAAGVAALSMSGFKGDVTFLGFPPRREGKRREFLQGLAREPRVLILYESPRRLGTLVAELARVMADRDLLVVRELTKRFEETWRGPVPRVAAELAGAELKGECTLVLSCPHGRPALTVDVDAHLLETARSTGLSGRRLAEEAARALDLPKRQVYQAYLALKQQGRLP
ncbi:MAG: 16S rRNA (cytidine(1402)-2'-O)-methyltransferase [Deltaproteobacteria bacterium]|nr:16S rRNA (cytidine(1402)-2'-O)-methyltransferase [Deltaproteobacteria bacterium]